MIDPFLVGPQSWKEIGLTRLRRGLAIKAAPWKPAERPAAPYRGWSPYWDLSALWLAGKAALAAAPRAAKAMALQLGQERFAEMAGAQPDSIISSYWDVAALEGDDRAQCLIDLARRARLDGMAAAGVRHVRWRAAWDCSPLCLAADGRIYEAASLGSQLRLLPGFIQHCRCEIEPVTSYIPQSDEGNLRGFALDKRLIATSHGGIETLLPQDWQPYLSVIPVMQAAGWSLPPRIEMVDDVYDSDECQRSSPAQNWTGQLAAMRFPDKLLVSRYAAEHIAPDHVLIEALAPARATSALPDTRAFAAAPHLLSADLQTPSSLLAELGEDDFRQEAQLCGIAPSLVDALLEQQAQRAVSHWDCYRQSWLITPSLIAP